MKDLIADRYVYCKLFLDVLLKKNIHSILLLARVAFGHLFHDEILRFKESFPPNYLSSNKLLFSEVVHSPYEEVFEVANPIHLEYLFAYGEFIICLFNLKIEFNEMTVLKGVE